ncbi:MAG: ferredoxin [Planctomycetaceae bacterium]|nr:ferredoxin [Planctomycetaceae bacterium]
MARTKLTVVISQQQGKNPAKRQLEEEIASALLIHPDVDLSLVPHLYDLSSDHTGMVFLKSVPGDLIVLSWLYPRASRWVLDRNSVRGREGVVTLVDDALEDEAEQSDHADAIGSLDVPDRRIYCIDLRVSTDAQDYIDEVNRITSEASVQTVELMSWINGNPKADQLQRYLNPQQQLDESRSGSAASGESTKRRWYPVIDYSRCTSCMECIDFCLFGVYGIDKHDRILVELEDNCKKGCPACSRVCPENAIVFPGHKTPAIAGAEGGVAGLKIDLSRLFGAPSGVDMAVRERDAELVNDGRDAVGAGVGLRTHETDEERDELDDLIDSLDELDL